MDLNAYTNKVQVILNLNFLKNCVCVSATSWFSRQMFPVLRLRLDHHTTRLHAGMLWPKWCGVPILILDADLHCKQQHYKHCSSGAPLSSPLPPPHPPSFFFFFSSSFLSSLGSGLLTYFRHFLSPLCAQFCHFFDLVWSLDCLLIFITFLIWFELWTVVFLWSSCSNAPILAIALLDCTPYGHNCECLAWLCKSNVPLCCNLLCNLCCNGP